MPKRHQEQINATAEVLLKAIQERAASDSPDSDALLQLTQAWSLIADYAYRNREATISNERYWGR